MQKNADSSKIKGFLVLKGIFSETKYVLCLRTKFQVYSKFLKSFWRRIILPSHHPPSTAKRTREKAAQIRVTKTSLNTIDLVTLSIHFFATYLLDSIFNIPKSLFYAHTISNKVTVFTRQVGVERKVKVKAAVLISW